MVSRTLKLILVVVFLSCSAITFAADIYVNHEQGDDHHTGFDASQPIRTIHLATKLAKPGDTIHLAPTTLPYRESVDLFNRSGEEGKPITVDGHGATLLGTDRLKAEQWKEVSPGLFRSDVWYKAIRADDAVIVRYFFTFDGRMERMGRSSKGPKEPWHRPEELKPGEWTFLEKEKVFYVKIEPGTSLDSANIEAPVRSSGVMLHGNCEHIVIRNMTATHVYNDGYNIHGRTRDVLFQNIRAIECGDDGVSAHDDCRIKVDGLLSFGNSTGMTNAGDSESESDHVVIAGCHGFGYFMFQGGRHVLRNSYIDADVPNPVSVEGGGPRPDAICHMTLDNVYIAASGKFPEHGVRVGKLGSLDATRVTTINLPWVIQGHAIVHDSVLVGDAKSVLDLRTGCSWMADRNAYALHQILKDGKAISFEEFRKGLGQDAMSTWAQFDAEHPMDITQTMHLNAGQAIGAEAALVVDPKSLPQSSERAAK